MLTFLMPRVREQTEYDSQSTSQVDIYRWDWSGGGWNYYFPTTEGVPLPLQERRLIREEMFGRRLKPPYVDVITTETYHIRVSWNKAKIPFPGGNGWTPWIYGATYAKNIFPESWLGLPGEYPMPDGFGASLMSQCAESVAKGDPEAEAMQCLPFIGELKESIAMMRDPFSFIQQLLKRVARRGLKKGRRWKTLKEAMKEEGMTATSGGFLAYTYGWNPLVQDLNKLAVQLGSFSDTYDEYLRLHDGSQPPKTFKKWSHQVVETTLPPNWQGQFFKVDVSVQQSAGCMLCGTYVPGAETLSKSAFLRQKLGLTPRNLLATAWELRPLSFVIDWFLPVGKVLDAITALPTTYRVSKTQYTYTEEEKTSVVLDRLPNDPGGNPWSSMGTKVVERSVKFYAKQAKSMFAGEPLWSINPNVLAALALIQQRLHGRIQRK